MEHHVPSPPISFGHSSFDQTGFVQNVEMMGEEIPGKTDEGPQLLHAQVALRQGVHQRQADFVSECGMKTRSLVTVH